MRYIDTGIAEADQTVAWWMQQTVLAGQCEFRCQSGYFTLEGSGPLLPSLQEWAERGSTVRLLLGSNRASTLASHVSYLAGRLGLPRAHVSLGVVSFDASLFHPKVYHFVRQDLSETAYVGSANLTGPGISGSNVEAGVIIDTRDGDDAALLEGIRRRIDAWFDGVEEGLSLINSPEDIQRLLEGGYLSLRPQNPPAEAGLSDSEGESVGGPRRPRRVRLVRLPTLDTSNGEERASPHTDPERRSAGEEEFQPEIERRRRFLRHTEASFHYPQGTHLGHLLAILWVFTSGREGTAFDENYIRLSGSLGVGRIAGFRRQIKYKLLAAMEIGVITDIRYVDDSTAFSPALTDRGRLMWQLLRPYVDVRELRMSGGLEPSSILPQPPSYYNNLIRSACADSKPLQDAYSDTMLGMPAVAQMLEFIGEFPEDRVSKNDIYEGFFSYPRVIEFCNEVGIEPQTEESARHRCPFLLNILESLGRVDQERTHIIRR